MYLRAYREADFEAMYALDRACFAPRFRFSRAVMRGVVGAREAVVLLACESNERGEEVMLGFCAAQVDKGDKGQRYGYVATLDVALEARGRGVGRALMLGLEEAVVRAGVTMMLLHVHVGNAGALALYEGLGYRRVDLEVGFYGEGFDGWLYQKGLTAWAL